MRKHAGQKTMGQGSEQVVKHNDAEYLWLGRLLREQKYLDDYNAAQIRRALAALCYAPNDEPAHETQPYTKTLLQGIGHKFIQQIAALVAQQSTKPQLTITDKTTTTILRAMLPIADLLFTDGSSPTSDTQDEQLSIIANGIITGVQETIEAADVEQIKDICEDLLKEATPDDEADDSNNFVNQNHTTTIQALREELAHLILLLSGAEPDDTPANLFDLDYEAFHNGAPYLNRAENILSSQLTILNSAEGVTQDTIDRTLTEVYKIQFVVKYRKEHGQYDSEKCRKKVALTREQKRLQQKYLKNIQDQVSAHRTSFNIDEAFCHIAPHRTRSRLPSSASSIVSSTSVSVIDAHTDNESLQGGSSRPRTPLSPNPEQQAHLEELEDKLAQQQQNLAAMQALLAEQAAKEQAALRTTKSKQPLEQELARTQQVMAEQAAAIEQHDAILAEYQEAYDAEHDLLAEKYHHQIRLLAEYQEEHAHLKESLGDSKEQLHQTTQAKQAIQQRASDFAKTMEEALTASEKALIQAQKELVAEKTAREAAVALTGELQTKLSAAQTATADLELENTTAQSQLAAAAAALGKTKAEHNEATAALQATHTDSIHALEAQLAHAQADSRFEEALERALAEEGFADEGNIEGTFQAAMQDIDKSEEHTAEHIAALQQQLMQAHSIREAADISTTELQAKLGAAQTATADLRQEHAAELEAQLTAAAAALGKTKAEHNEATAALQATHTDSIHTLEAQLMQAHSIREAADISTTELQAKLSAAQIATADLRQEHAAELDAQLTAAAAALGKTKVEHNEATAALQATHTDSIHALEAQLVQARSAREAAVALTGELQTKLSAAQIATADLRQEHAAELDAQLTAAAAALGKTKVEHNEATAALQATHTDSIHALEAQLAHAQADSRFEEALERALAEEGFADEGNIEGTFQTAMQDIDKSEEHTAEHIAALQQQLMQAHSIREAADISTGELQTKLGAAQTATADLELENTTAQAQLAAAAAVLGKTKAEHVEATAALQATHATVRTGLEAQLAHAQADNRFEEALEQAFAEEGFTDDGSIESATAELQAAEADASVAEHIAQLEAQIEELHIEAKASEAHIQRLHDSARKRTIKSFSQRKALRAFASRHSVDAQEEGPAEDPTINLTQKFAEVVDDPALKALQEPIKQLATAFNKTAQQQIAAFHTHHQALVARICTLNAEIKKMTPAWLKIQEKQQKKADTHSPRRQTGREGLCTTYGEALSSDKILYEEFADITDEAQKATVALLDRLAAASGPAASAEGSDGGVTPLGTSTPARSPRSSGSSVTLAAAPRTPNKDQQKNQLPVSPDGPQALAAALAQAY